MRTRQKGAVFLGIALIACVAGLHAQEWPQWRGPHGDGVSDETALPLHWSKTENVAWRVAIPGKGHSSPVIWGNRIFLTTCIEADQKRLLLCLDRRDGKLLWQREVLTARLEQKHDLNSFASSTPATDGRYVWVSFLDVPTVQVACYDMEGNLIWRRSPGEFHSRHGFCSSPVPYKDTIILNCDQDAPAYIVALDKTSGADRWRADRPNRTRSYCTPLILNAAGKQQLMLSGSKCVASYDPDTGRQYWIIDGPTEQFVAGLVFTDDVLFVTGGFPELHLLGIRPDGEGNVTKTHILWHQTRGASYVPSPIAHGHYFYVVADGGMASCLEARTGKRQWSERLGRHHSASPVSAGDYLYFLADEGEMIVLKAGKTFQVVARNKLEDECRASPAISRGQIFIRTLHDLYCIGAAGKS